MFNKLSRLLGEKFGNRSNIAKQIEIARVFAAYQKAAAEFFPHEEPPAAPVSLRNRILTVRAQSSAAANELRLRENQLLLALGKEFGPDVVQKIIYRF